MHIIGPVFAVDRLPSWAGATWIGEITTEHSAQEELDPIAVPGAEGYERARLLVRKGHNVVGFVTIDIAEGRADHGEVQAALRELPDVHDCLAEASIERQPFSVIVCTRDRPDDLRTALNSLLRLKYEADVQIVVVDNAPATNTTRDLVAGLGDDRVVVVTEPKPGLSNARNAGVHAARNEWIAFTDDDVVVDPDWLEGLARGFTRGGDSTWCVSGLVPTGELRSPSQAWFDQRIGWSSALLPRIFDLKSPPADVPYFPFQVGRYGTGANFATKRSVVNSVGGFDAHLGAGTASKGGEDIDFFYRVIARGGHLVYEPSALVWHRHRETVEALKSQAVGYGRGLAAWGTKLLLSPGDLGRGLRVLLRRESWSLAPLRDYRNPMGPTTTKEAPIEVADITSIEHRALLSGPWAYVGPRFFRQ